ncbi:universal stress protein [Brevibacillus fluminis]|uniref:universal stress protein n=1 Tax=Brevibacillus fluminis TaxID=511487 RepID=UPI003F88D887
MFTNILVAVDGSETSQKAVEWAKKTHEALPEAKITFVHVFQPFVPVIAGYPAAVIPQPQDVLSPEETPSYQAWAQFEDKSRVAYRNILGGAAEEICNEAEAKACDLIVVGSVGHGLVSSVLLGSVSAKVLHHAKCSVLIVR